MIGYLVLRKRKDDGRGEGEKRAGEEDTQGVDEEEMGKEERRKRI